MTHQQQHRTGTVPEQFDSASDGLLMQYAEPTASAISNSICALEGNIGKTPFQSRLITKQEHADRSREPKLINNPGLVRTLFPLCKTMNETNEPRSDIRIKNSYDKKDSKMYAARPSTTCTRIMHSEQHKQNLTPTLVPKVKKQLVIYKIGEDTLVKHADDRFYLGTVIGVRETHCLVRYDNATVEWSAYEDMSKLSQRAIENTGLICNICEQESDEKSLEICGRCRWACHLKCAQYDLCLEILSSLGTWLCTGCNPPEESDEHGSDGGLNASVEPIEELQPRIHKDQLPYLFDELEWDLRHRKNSEGHYCYCGQDGDWKKEMLQCRRCQQWFHGRCIRSLQYPIFLGDQFYFFLCTICNYGHEFVRRLEISSADLIHLILYNLIARNAKRFYNIRHAIVPYIEENLRTLQLPDQLVLMSTDSRVELILQTLESNRLRFLSMGRSTIDKLWTLKIFCAPQVLPCVIPQDIIITEPVLSQLALKNPNLRFIPRKYLEHTFVSNACCRERMTGSKYSIITVQEPDDNLSTTSTSTDSTYYEENSSTSSVAVRRTTVFNDLPSTSTAKRTRVQRDQRSIENNTKPQIKTHRNCPNVADTSTKRIAARKNATVVRRKFIKRKKPKANASRITVRELPPLHELIPPLKNYEGRNNPFHPLFNERHLQGPIVAYGDRPEEIIPSGAKKRKCYRKPIPYHLLLAPTTNPDNNMASHISGNGCSNGYDPKKQQQRDIIRSSSSSNDEVKDATSPLPTTSYINQNIKQIYPTSSANSTQLQFPRYSRLRFRTEKNYSDTKRYKPRKDQTENKMQIHPSLAVSEQQSFPVPVDQKQCDFSNYVGYLSVSSNESCRGRTSSSESMYSISSIASTVGVEQNIEGNIPIRRLNCRGLAPSELQLTLREKQGSKCVIRGKRTLLDGTIECLVGWD